MPSSDSGRRRPRPNAGQTVVIFALCFTVLVAFAGLAIDGGHLFLVNRQSQNATDAAALAAAKQLAAAGKFLTGPPEVGDPAVKAAHDLASANGFPTVFSTACASGSGTALSVSWYDRGGCSVTSFGVRVTLNSPPQGTLSRACQAAPYNCIQVVITRRVENYLMGVLGIPVTATTTLATAYAQPPGTAYNLPGPTAVYLYEPGSNCASGNQCFKHDDPPSRQRLSCSGGNCPTFWSATGSAPVIAGLDATVTNGSDVPAVESNGDMVMQDRTTFCDPYGGAACVPGIAVGAKGFSISSGSSLFCSGFASGTANGLASCLTGSLPGLGSVAANETAFAPHGWTPTFNFTGPDCGTLVLNGGSVQPTNPSCTPPSSEPYTIMPGQYGYIVINHGRYDFQAGLYDITATAPPSVINHGLESVADFDLCGSSCPTLTAGIWIGHGSNPYLPGAAGDGTSCGGAGAQGGGGDLTVVTGSGVSFRFESNSGGLVSTREVSQIALSAPGLGAAQGTAGIPLLFDLENKGFIHLDSGWAGGRTVSHFTGILYQSPNAAGGGVELNPGLGISTPTLRGQVLAYSLTTFGEPGVAIDFSKGFGASTPIIATGHAEPEIVDGVSVVAGPTPNSESVVINFNDEWALNAYDAYVKINNGNPQFFSKGIWQVTPGPNDALPPNPNGNGPSDVPSAAAYPNRSQPSASNYSIRTDANGLPDWTYSFGDGSSFEVDGNWTWGHEQDISGAVATWADAATLTYTFPTPPGSSVNVQVYLDDGDHCGDYAVIDDTFDNIGEPAGGQQTQGTVRLEQ